MSDDQRAIYLEGAHDEEPGHVCLSCCCWFPESEYTQDWRDQIPEDAAFSGEDGEEFSVAKCCTNCVDGYFEGFAPCVQRCSDGSYQPA